MRYFVTGASGFVGSAVTRELLAAGHQVMGVARSDEGAARVAAMGAEVFRGSLDDPEELARAAAETDGVAHLAFNHDISKFLENCATDLRVVTTIGAALAGTGKPLIVTSGLGLLTGLPLITEDLTMAAVPHPHPRGKSEDAVTALAEQGVRAMVIRLAPSTHGDGDHGFVPILINNARDKGAAAYVGAGDAVWPGVHRLERHGSVASLWKRARPARATTRPTRLACPSVRLAASSAAASVCR
ncbi:MAG TPA: NAD-dependent epimerase/dehydratase family protein [Acidisoma sp.]|jgi:nucleoside-diphosphate-sugar epimerase|nr:NAD-dependent epimerase/dehydratase family protein [Acidisoma sp.]